MISFTGTMSAICFFFSLFLKINIYIIQVLIWHLDGAWFKKQILTPPLHTDIHRFTHTLPHTYFYTHTSFVSLNQLATACYSSALRRWMLTTSTILIVVSASVLPLLPTLSVSHLAGPPHLWTRDFRWSTWPAPSTSPLITSRVCNEKSQIYLHPHLGLMFLSSSQRWCQTKDAPSCPRGLPPAYPATRLPGYPATLLWCRRLLPCLWCQSSCCLVTWLREFHGGWVRACVRAEVWPLSFLQSHSKVGIQMKKKLAHSRWVRIFFKPEKVRRSRAHTKLKLRH